MIDALVTKVRDKERFFHYCILKFRIRRNTIHVMTHDINRGYHVKLRELPECDVRYLQQYVCNLKVIKYTPMRPRVKAPTDISPQPGDELKQEPLDLFHVTFTKIIHYDEMLNERQIQALLKDKNVKSINIDK